jgi:ABC-type bacteriocin/lantibiotic exporter with double-glycine peptidase domain
VYQFYATRVYASTKSILSERRRQLIYSGSSLGIIAVASTIMLGVGGVAVMRGALTVGGYIAFYTYLLRLFEPLNTAVDLFARLQRSGVSIARLQSISENAGAAEIIPPALADRPSPAKSIDTHRQRSACEHLSCSRLSFRYSSQAPVFDQVSFDVRKGERLLIDGPSGAGKSTLLKVIAGVYPDYQGDIVLDGIKIEPGINIGSCVGFVSQHPVLFSASLRDNLLLGSPDSSLPDIEEALYLSCSDSLLSSLPRGLEHVIGQSGAGLSGGERQRIALARAILQKRPIFLLDEATSGLDSSTKRLLFSRLEQFTRSRITVLVSHDPMCKDWAHRHISLSSRREVDADSIGELSAAAAFAEPDLWPRGQTESGLATRP